MTAKIQIGTVVRNGWLSGKRIEPTYDICVNQCGAVCCKTPGSFGVDQREMLKLRRLAKEKGVKLHAISRPFQRGRWVVNFAEQTHQRCPFLGDDNLCSIYDQRPEACRQYPTRYEKQCMLCLKQATPEQVVEAKKEGRLNYV